MKMPDLEKLAVPEKSKIKLSNVPTKIEPLYESKKKYREQLDDYTEKLQELQNVLYAHNRYALLLIFQAMDAAGKDGAIKHVMSGVNPQGCQVFSFKQPSSEELDHDFLWRTHKRAPERGRIGIFNRSYYEEVLIVRVHPNILENQNIPEEFLNEKKFWKHRYADIVNHEKYLHRNGTRILKFFLHLSKKEQRKRFLSRIDESHKNWKLSMGDIEERKLWDKYQTAYQKCLRKTSTTEAPWYVIPADDKRNARLLISNVIVSTLKSLSLHYPEVSKKQLEDIENIRIMLSK